MKSIKIVLALFATLAAAFIFNATPAQATYPTSPNQIVFGSNSAYGGNASFYPGEFDLYSANGRDHLGFGMSGNFAGYDSAGRQWFSANTTGTGAELRLQTDGNVVVYDSGHPAGTFISQQPLWASGIYGHFYWWRITMGGDGHWSLWGGYSTTNWLRVASFGNGF